MFHQLESFVRQGKFVGLIDWEKNFMAELYSMTNNASLVRAVLEEHSYSYAFISLPTLILCHSFGHNCHCCRSIAASLYPMTPNGPGVYSHRYLGHWVAWLTFPIDISPISLQNDVLASGWIEKSHHVPEVIEIRDFFPPNHERAFFSFCCYSRRISKPRPTAWVFWSIGLRAPPALFFCEKPISRRPLPRHQWSRESISQLFVDIIHR